MPHVDQELFALLQHQGSPLVFSVVPVARSLVFCVVFCTSLFVLLSFCPFVLFRVTIVLSDLRFTAFDYHFGILDLRLLNTTLVS
jgi:hypothetical protein